MFRWLFFFIFSVIICFGVMGQDAQFCLLWPVRSIFIYNWYRYICTGYILFLPNQALVCMVPHFSFLWINNLRNFCHINFLSDKLISEIISYCHVQGLCLWLWSALNCQAVGVDHHCRSLPTEIFYSIPSFTLCCGTLALFVMHLFHSLFFRPYCLDGKVRFQ